ncbi:unnamed protein product, partial [Didymodactylos carnosus]
NMPFLQKQLIILIVILINSINIGTNPIELTETQLIYNTTMDEYPKLRNKLKTGKQQSKIEKRFLSSSFNNNRWIENIITIAGGNGKGNQSNQLMFPQGIYIDYDSQVIYIADSENHRIIKWRFNNTNGEIVAGGNGKGNGINQLDSPKDVVFDKKSNSLFICDTENRRIVQWFNQINKNPQIITSDITCWSIKIDRKNNLYVSDYEKRQIRRWKIGENPRTDGILVAGGNGQGDRLNQLAFPTSIFVDQDYTIYAADGWNNRIMKWIKDAKEGIILAGRNGKGDGLTQLHFPQGLIVDHWGQIYVADGANNRVMRFSNESSYGVIVMGGNGQGKKLNQLIWPSGLSFDREGNLYVADWGNHRIQKIRIN